MENISQKGGEAISETHETAVIMTPEQPPTNSSEVVDAAPKPPVERESTERIKSIRQDILNTNGTAKPKPVVQAPAVEKPVITGGGGGFGAAFGEGMGKFLKGGFVFLAGVIMIGLSEGFLKVSTWAENFLKKNGGGKGGGSHAKAAPKHAAGKSHAPAAPKGGGGGHDGHH